MGAKIYRMLFEFHRLQNGKKPGSIHATYLVAGNRRRGNHGQTNGNTRSDGEDAYMQSSPFQSSPVLQLQEPIDDSSVLSITLVKEENLEGISKLSLTQTMVADIIRNSDTL